MILAADEFDEYHCKFCGKKIYVHRNGVQAGVMHENPTCETFIAKMKELGGRHIGTAMKAEILKPLSQN